MVDSVVVRCVVCLCLILVSFLRLGTPATGQFGDRSSLMPNIAYSDPPSLLMVDEVETSVDMVSNLVNWVFAPSYEARAVKVIEEFLGREDRLIYRSGLYDPEATEIVQNIPGQDKSRLRFATLFPRARVAGITTRVVTDELARVCVCVWRDRNHTPNVLLDATVNTGRAAHILVKVCEKFSRNVQVTAGESPARTSALSCWLRLTSSPAQTRMWRSARSITAPTSRVWTTTTRRTVLCVRS